MTLTKLQEWIRGYFGERPGRLGPRLGYPAATRDQRPDGIVIPASYVMVEEAAADDPTGALTQRSAATTIVERHEGKGTIEEVMLRMQRSFGERLALRMPRSKRPAATYGQPPDGSVIPARFVVVAITPVEDEPAS